MHVLCAFMLVPSIIIYCSNRTALFYQRLQSTNPSPSALDTRLTHEQVLLLDQRGTGLSSPITAATLATRGNAVEQAEYLKRFRADNIVRDCESVRKILTADYAASDKQKWSILGQSFGGFCCATYLSKLCG